MIQACKYSTSRKKTSTTGKYSKQILSSVSGLVSGLILVILPKCPACVAAYFAFLTGVGLSTPVAGFLRTSLLILCTVSLVIAIFFIIKKRGISWNVR
ncbi:MAG: hypothetical protein QM501_12075 [Gimesia sp.]